MCGDHATPPQFTREEKRHAAALDKATAKEDKKKARVERVERARLTRIRMVNVDWNAALRKWRTDAGLCSKRPTLPKKKRKKRKRKPFEYEFTFPVLSKVFYFMNAVFYYVQAGASVTLKIPASSRTRSTKRKAPADEESQSPEKGRKHKRVKRGGSNDRGSDSEV